MSDLRTPGLFDPETVECALTDAQVLGRQLPVSSFQVLCLAAEAWLADSSLDYERADFSLAGLLTVYANATPEVRQMMMADLRWHTRQVVDAAFPRLDRE